MGPSGGGAYNFSGATQLNKEDSKPFNFNLGASGSGFPSQPTYGGLLGQPQSLASGQPPVLGGLPFGTGIQPSLGQTQSAAQRPPGLFGLPSKPFIPPPQGGGSTGFFSGGPGGTTGGQSGGTPNLFQTSNNQPIGGLLQSSPGQTGPPKLGIYGSTFSPQSAPGSQKPGTNLFSLNPGGNPPQPSLFNLPQNSQPQAPAGSLVATPSMQSRAGLQLGTNSPFSGGTQPQGAATALFNTPNSTFTSSGMMLGTSSQTQVASPSLFPATQDQGARRPFQGTGMTLGGTGLNLVPGTQPPGAGLILGTGTQPPGAGLNLVPGTQLPGAGLILGTGTQPQGTGLNLLPGTQLPGAGLILGTGTQPPGAGLNLGTGTQPTGAGLILGTGRQPPGAGLTLGTGTHPQGAGLNLGIGLQPQGTGLNLSTGLQPHGTGLTLGTGTQAHGIGTQLQSMGAQPFVGIQTPQMFTTPQNQTGITSALPQVASQKLTPQSAVAPGQSPLPQTLHMSHLLPIPGSQTPITPQNQIRMTQTPSHLTLSASPASSQAQPARPALFQLPSSQIPSSLPQVPPSIAPTLLAPFVTQATQLPVASIYLPTSLQSVAPTAITVPTVIGTTAASSIPIVPLSAASTSGLSSVTQTPAKKYTYRQLEDVINNWVMELDDQQKVFLNQAKQVNAWDLALLENEDSIIALHDELERAKTDQDRLDHDLNSILNQQQELEEMLTPLETYISSQPMHASTQHADQERNKTYSMAEKIDGSMKDMLQSLREVLEKINSVNAANSDRNSPISHITGILNVHMDMLLFIDESSNSLQQKLDELSRKLGSKKQDQEAKLKTAFN